MHARIKKVQHLIHALSMNSPRRDAQARHHTSKRLSLQVPLPNDPNGHQLEGEYGCHFRANNFLSYFPGHHEFDWRLKGTATCVPTECVQVYQTDDDDDESKQVQQDWDWEEYH